VHDMNVFVCQYVRFSGAESDDSSNCSSLIPYSTYSMQGFLSCQYFYPESISRILRVLCITYSVL